MYLNLPLFFILFFLSHSKAYDADYVNPDQDYEASSNQNGNGCYKDGFHSNPLDCAKFVRCVSNGISFNRYDFDCGPGTHFDEGLGLCNHPNALNPKSRCYKGPRRNSNYGAHNGHNQRLTENYGGRIGQQLSNRQSQSSSAPVFAESSSTSSISIESRVSSQSSSDDVNLNDLTPEPQEAENSTENFIPVCAHVGFFPNSQNCSKFYRCLNYHSDGENSSYIVVQFECRQGELYDPTIPACAPAQYVQRPECHGINSTQNETGRSLELDQSWEQIAMERAPLCPILVSIPNVEESGNSLNQIYISTILTPPVFEPIEPGNGTRGNLTQTESPITSSTAIPLETETTPLPPPTAGQDEEQILTCGQNMASKFLRVNPFDCSQFYFCVWTQNSFMIKFAQCPPTQVFVEDEQKCVNKTSDVFCVSDPPVDENILEVPENSTQNSTDEIDGIDSTTATPEPITQLINPDNSCPAEGNFGIANDCLRFYYCRKQENFLVALLMKCPDDFHFSQGLCRRSTNFIYEGGQLEVTCPQKLRLRSKGRGSRAGLAETMNDDKIWHTLGVPVPRPFYHMFVEN